MADRARISLTWNGTQRFREIKEDLRRRLIIATKLVQSRTKRKIKVWGSDPKGKVRVDHSLPGQPPLRQTGNLYNSIKTNTRLINRNIIGEIFTDVPYAADLEIHGLGTVKRHRSKHTSRKLINPLPLSAKPRGRRPFMKSTFVQSRRTVLRILAGKGIIGNRNF